VTDTDIQKLRELAEAATPGTCTHGCYDGDGNRYCYERRQVNRDLNDALSVRAVIALLDDLDEAKRLVGTWQAHSIEAADRRSEALGQLAAVTAARDEACDLAKSAAWKLHRECPNDLDLMEHADTIKRIAALRKVGQP
jgi:hypothetical protein